jgi:eukaryotic-like serine/threonine-protein kinase
MGVEEVSNKRVRNYLDRAQTNVLEIMKLLGESPDSDSKARIYGLQAQIYLRHGDTRLAMEAAEVATTTLGAQPPTVYFVLGGYAGPAEVYCTLYEKEQASAKHGSSQLVKLARRSCKALRRFASVFLIARPSASLWQGLYNWLDGKPDKAHREWAKRLAYASQYAMPYDEERAHYQIGRHLPEGDLARREHLTLAAAIFERLCAAYDLAQTEALLNTN